MKWLRPWLIVVIAVSAPPPGQAGPVVFPTPETIRAQGVPPVPAAVRQALNQYLSIRAASFEGWEANGKGMYINDAICRPASGALCGQAGGSTQPTDVWSRAGGNRFTPSAARPVSFFDG